MKKIFGWLFIAAWISGIAFIVYSIYEYFHKKAVLLAAANAVSPGVGAIAANDPQLAQAIVNANANNTTGLPLAVPPEVWIYNLLHPNG